MPEHEASIVLKECPRRTETPWTYPINQANTAEPYQFQSSKETGRVHGFFIDLVFHVVWLDPYHRLYA